VITICGPFYPILVSKCDSFAHDRRIPKNALFLQCTDIGLAARLDAFGCLGTVLGSECSRLREGTLDIKNLTGRRK
jgi:hypothetical protein